MKPDPSLAKTPGWRLAADTVKGLGNARERGAVVNDTATAGPLLRWTRALVLAAVGLTTGATFHVSADGLLPGPWVLVALYGLSTGAAAPLLGTPASTRRVVALLVVWQTLIHAALTALSGHGRALSSTPGEAGAHAHGVVSTGVHHVVADSTGPHAAMAAGHLLAALLVGLWLAAGERALWRLLTLAVRPVLSVVGSLSGVALGVGCACAPVRVTAPQVMPGAYTLSLWFLVRGVPRRGPPVAA
jgi:hypothetical protein